MSDAPPSGVSAPTAAPAALPDGYEQVPHTFVKFALRRRAAARAMAAASQIPTLTADVQVDLSSVLAVRAQWNQAQDDLGARLSVLAFVAKAAVAALNEHRDLNASYAHSGLLRWDTVNLGVAVDSEAGLIVPNIAGAEHLNAAAIGAAVKDLAARARARGITPSDLSGGTFTVSNPGAVGPSLRAEALLNPPQVALLGLPGMHRMPIVVKNDQGDETVQIRSVLNPSLSFDHRALDGGQVIRYLVTLKSYLETWTLEQFMADGGPLT